MTPSSIISAVQDAIQNSASLSYVADDSVYLGVRENITIFPCVIIEPVGDRLLEETFAYEERVLSINITGYAQVHDKDLQLIGNAAIKGVLDIENDIRKAISSDITLGLSDVYDTRLVSTVHDFSQYPIRGFAINVECHYRQDRVTRT